MPDDCHIAGICGSVWATPVMKIVYNDGSSKIIDCYTNSSNEQASDIEIDQMKSFAVITGGMDQVD